MQIATETKPESKMSAVDNETTPTDLRVVMFTWNVATMEPPDNGIVKDLVWIHTKERPDMYVVTLQEVSSKPHEVILSTITDGPWVTAISGHVCDRGYVLVSSVRLQGIILLVYATMMHLPFLYNIHTAFQRTGIGGYWGNKGAVAVRLNCYGRSICFVAVHMAPHVNQWETRDKEYYQIVSGLTFPLEDSPHALYHNYIFWLGDLNYRFDDLSKENVKFLSAPNKLHVLRERDQLLLTVRNKRAFDQFQEGIIEFMPTYKFDLHTNEYDSSPKDRQPAWTDRILWRVTRLPSDEPTDSQVDVEQITYDAHGDAMYSDHRPVWADFKIQVSSIDKGRPLVVFDPIEWWTSRESVCTYTVKGDTRTSAWDWIGLYKLGFQTIERHHCTYEWAVEIKDDRHHRCRVNFSRLSLPTDYEGKYVLCYNSSVSKTVLGVSNVFRIKPLKDS